jgi:two-component system, OmpR family, alkaline phosphatase synthesis response regulator PhoP
MFGTPKNRILCVEDNPDVCELIAAILTDYEVISASGTEDAWRKFGEQRYSLVVLDYHLVDGDGLALCDRIRQIDSGTPVVFITGDHELTDEAVRKAGGQRRIAKSHHRFNDHLLECVETLSVAIT